MKEDRAMAVAALTLLAAMGLLFIFGMTWLSMLPDINTVTVYKQDRLSLPCPQGGE
jgi:hypothetical protein